MSYKVTFVIENKGRTRQLFKKASEAFTPDRVSDRDLSCGSAPLRSFVEKGYLAKISINNDRTLACHLNLKDFSYVSRDDVSLLAESTKSGFFGSGVGISHIKVTSDTDTGSSLLITKGGVIESQQGPRTMVADYPAPNSLVERLHNGMTRASRTITRFKSYARPALLRRFL